MSTCFNFIESVSYARRFFLASRRQLISLTNFRSRFGPCSTAACAHRATQVSPPRGWPPDEDRCSGRVGSLPEGVPSCGFELPGFVVTGQRCRREDSVLCCEFCKRTGPALQN